LPQDVSAIKPAVIAVCALAFLLLTGLQSIRTTAELALFSNKLGLAILIAALIRVHRGWPSMIAGSPFSSTFSEAHWIWLDLSQLAFALAPLAFLAGNFGYRSQGRRPVVITAIMGIALPLSITVLLVGIIDVATLRSGFYVPSLEPTVAMALWSHAASSALPPRMLLAAITAFGAARFGIRALVESASIGRLQSWRVLALFACLGCAVARYSADPFNQTLDRPFDLLTSLLAVTSAVVTADLVTRFWRVAQTRRLDWIGVGAVSAGLATALYLSTGNESLLPSYATASLACILGRSVQAFAVRRLETRMLP
jgi:hypothetical protein